MTGPEREREGERERGRERVSGRERGERERETNTRMHKWIGKVRKTSHTREKGNLDKQADKLTDRMRNSKPDRDKRDRQTRREIW